MGDATNRRTGIETDAAALAAGALAVVLTMYLDEGQYEVLGAIVSLTLVCTLLSYLLGGHDNEWQRLAFAAVVGLTATPLTGFLIEVAMRGEIASFFSWSELPRKVEAVEKEEVTSQVGNLSIISAWLGAGALAWIWDGRVSRRRKVH
jgi:hypothetical protein